MSAQNNYEPAFPVQDASTWQAHEMSLRDYFAAKCMQALVALPNVISMDAVARDSYKQADAMLAERAK